MATQILQADVDGPNTAWGYAGSTNIAVVMGTDDATDEIDRIHRASDNSSRHEWYMDALSPAAISVDSVDSRFYVRSNQTGETIRAYIHDGSNQSDIRNADPGGSIGNYTAWNDTGISHPTSSFSPGDFPGGGSGIYQGVQSSSNLSGTVFCTYAHLSVDFTPGGGGFAFLISSFIPPLLGVASHAVLNREIARFFAMAKLRPSYREEFEAVKRELLVRPAYAF